MKNTAKTNLISFVFLILLLSVSLFFIATYTQNSPEGIISTASAEETPPTITIDNVEVLRGKSFHVNVSISNNTGFSAIRLLLNYNPAVMTLTNVELKREGLKDLTFSTSNTTSDKGFGVLPFSMMWDGSHDDTSNGAILTLYFTTRSSALVTPDTYNISMSYSAIDTITYSYESGTFSKKAVSIVGGNVKINAGAYQCTYYDYDGREIAHYEENDYSLFASELADPPDPTREADYKYSYQFAGWDGTKPDSEEDKGVYDIVATYTATPMPYEIYYYLGEKNVDTGVIALDTTADLYHQVTSFYGAEIAFPAYQENYYSFYGWFTDIACTLDLTTNYVPEATDGSYALKLYSYRMLNAEVVVPEVVENTVSKIENVVTLDGNTVNVAVNLTRNFGLRAMTLTLEYDQTALTLLSFEKGTAFGDDCSFDHTNTDTADGLAIRPFKFLWQTNAQVGNTYKTGNILNLTFQLDTTADVGNYPITFSYVDRQDVSKYEIVGGVNTSLDGASLWYTLLNIKQGDVYLREVTKPTAQSTNWTFNNEEQTFSFADAGDSDEYTDDISSHKRTLHGQETITLSLIKGDNAYRFWADADNTRSVADLTFDFIVEKRAVTAPTAPTSSYIYNGEEQTYAFSAVGDNTYYTTTGSYNRTLVGKQVITASLVYPDESYWAGTDYDTTDKTYDFEILRKRITAPTTSTLTYTYNTLEQQYTFADRGDFEYYTITTGSDLRTLSGSQNVEVVLNDKNNYCWDETGDSTQDKTFLFAIEKRGITPPTVTTLTYTYSGSEKTYTFGAESQGNKELYYTVTANKRTLAGSYTADNGVKVALINTTDTYWTDTEDTLTKTFDFVIAKKEVVAPTESQQTFTFDNTAKTYVFATETGDSSLYTVTGDKTRTSSGATNITIALIDGNNYVWDSGNSDNIVFDFVISKREITSPTQSTKTYTYTQANITYQFGCEDTTQQSYYTVTGNVRKNVGSYTGDNGVKVALNYPQDSYWKDTEDTADKTFDFVISPFKVNKPLELQRSYTFDGTLQTFMFSTILQESYYDISDRTMRDAGEKTVTVSLKDKANYTWADDTTADLEFLFVIQKVKKVKPFYVDSQNRKTFTGEPLTFDAIVSNEYYTVSQNVRTDAGVYSGADGVIVTLTSNCCWDDNSTDPLQLTVTIVPLGITAPTAYTGSGYIYNGSSQEYIFGTEYTSHKDKYYTVSGATQTNAGDYDVTVSLVYPASTYWGSDSKDNADKKFTFTIAKQSVLSPEITSKQYTGTTLVADIEDTTLYTITTNMGGIARGDYSVVLTLTDSDNYKWSSSTEATLTLTFSIVQAVNSWATAPSISNQTYGETIIGGTATSQFGTPAITYKKATDDDSEYSAILPTNAGSYIAKFFVAETQDYSGLSRTLTFEIAKAKINVSQVAWSYTTPFVFADTQYSVQVNNIPQGIEVSYLGTTTAKDKGDYQAQGVFSYDTTNYELDFGTNQFSYTCSWQITPYIITLEWNYLSSYTFTGNPFEIPTASYKDVHNVTVNTTITEQDSKTFLNPDTYNFVSYIFDGNYSVTTPADKVLQIVVAKRIINIPTPTTTEFFYNGETQSYTFAESEDAEYYTVSNNTAKVVGEYVVTVALRYKSCTYWAGVEEDTADKTFDFVIERKQITKPLSTTSTYTFDISATQTYSFGSTLDLTYYSISGNTRQNSGSQTVTVALTDKDNYCWAGSLDTTDLSYDFVVNKRSIAKPLAYSGDYTYTGSVLTYTFDSPIAENYITVEGNKRTVVGSQTVTASLIDKANTYWGSDASDTLDLTYTFEVLPCGVIAPVAYSGEYVYNGGTITYTFDNEGDKDHYTLSGTMSRVNAGTTQIVATLTDKENYSWIGGGTADKTYDFVIAKLQITKPIATTKDYIYNGEIQTLEFSTAPHSLYCGMTGGSRKEAGSQTVTVYLTNKGDTCWAGSLDTTDLTFTLTIGQKEVAPPTPSNTTYTYNGEIQTYLFATEGDKDYYFTDALTMTNAGSKNIVLTLLDKNNYCWADSKDTENKIFIFEILKKKIAIPTDTTEYYCTGEVQTYGITETADYTVSGGTRKDAGSQKVTISLKDLDNCSWEDGTLLPIEYTFTISHLYNLKIQREEYFVSSADCTHGTTYYYLCVCGAVGDTTYEQGAPLGHIYSVEFRWAEDKATANVFACCTREGCDYQELIPAEMTADITPAGYLDGKIVYTASIFLDKEYKESKTVILSAIGHNYGAPLWIWTEEKVGYSVVANFYCIDSGFESYKETEVAVVTSENVSEAVIRYTATVLFGGVKYTDTRDFNKPALTFVFDNGTEDVTYYVMPDQDVTALIPNPPTKEDCIFAKWLSQDGIALIYSDTKGSYTNFVIRNESKTFTAVWQESGSITITVKDLSGAPIENVDIKIKKGETVVREVVTQDDGLAVFAGIDYGNYTIVITYNDGRDDIVYTTSAIVGKNSRKVDLSLTFKRFNTEVRSEDFDVTAENLDKVVSNEEKENIVKTTQEGDVVEISVTLTVKEEADNNKIQSYQNITDENQTIVQIADLSLDKKVVTVDSQGNLEENNTTVKTSDEVVKILLPMTEELYQALADVHGSIDNISVLRGYGLDESKVENLIKETFEVGELSTEECFYIQEEDGENFIAIKLKNFSSYAVCVNSGKIFAANEFLSMSVSNWTYGETPIIPTATAKYGEVKISYIDGEGLESSQLPNKAGIYTVKATVASNGEYAAIEQREMLVISKATYDMSGITFEDMSIAYDGEIHTIVVKGTLPDGVRVRYIKNGQTEIGEYLITAYFEGDYTNYYYIEPMTATLTIVSTKNIKVMYYLFWILLAIAVALIITSIVLASKKKKLQEALKESSKDTKTLSVSLLAILLLLSFDEWLFIIILLGIVDFALLIVVLVLWGKVKSLKKKLSAMTDKQVPSNLTTETTQEIPEQKTQNTSSDTTDKDKNN